MQFELPFGLGERRVSDGDWLAVGEKRVRLRLVRNRRARRYVLRLSRDGSARLTVPRGGSAGEAKRFAEHNLAWLEKQLLRQAARPVSPVAWTAGTEILYRGERVRLEVGGPKSEAGGWRAGEDAESASAGEDAPKLTSESSAPRPGHALVRFAAEAVPVADPDADLRPPVEKYLRRIAAQELTARVSELAAVHHLPVQRISVRNQRSRWGSCSRRGTISLNWRLVQTPVFVRDYIILHELAHLKEMNHSRRFWREVARLCPEFEQAERWLKQHSELLK